jgi:hypothetical protein
VVWARFDDNWDDEAVIAALTATAYRAYVSGLLYGARYLTDGRVPAIALRPALRRAADELVKAELWEPVDAGWYAPRWKEHYPSRDDLAAAREHARERQRRRRADP